MEEIIAIIGIFNKATTRGGGVRDAHLGWWPIRPKRDSQSGASQVSTKRARAVVLVTLGGLLVGLPSAGASETKAVDTRGSQSQVVPVPSAARFETSGKQVIVVSAPRKRTTHARLRAYQRGAGGWRQAMNVKARIGANGLVAGNKRQQGSNTTPTGMYSITQSFGVAANPGTSMPFSRVGPDHYWVGDNASPFYNEMRLGSEGGFKRKLSERMISYMPDYKYGAVIDFNRPNPIRGRGFAIFLHANGDGATAGCVSIGAKKMKSLLRWLNPAKSPTIVIGRDSWLKGSSR